MNANDIRDIGVAVAQAIVQARNGQDNAQIMSRKQADVRKAAASAPRFKLNDNFNAFRIRYESWRRASGIMETMEVPGAEGQPAQQAAVHTAEFQAEQLLVQFEGAAAERIRAIGYGSDTWNRCILDGNQPNQFVRFDNYLLAVQELFLPAAESTMSKQQFMMRIQKPNEDISAYISDKIIFYNLAYTADQRAQTYEFLRDKVIEGIYNSVIKKRLIENPPADEAALRAACTNFVAQERQKFLANCSDSPTLDGLKATSRGSYGDDAMDINAINAMRAATREDECYRCHKKGHFAQDCRVDLSHLPGAAAKGMFHAQRSNKAGRHNGDRGASNSVLKGKNLKDIECRYCKKRGHMVADCRKKRADQSAAARGRARGGGGAPRGGGRRRGGIREVGEPDQEEAVYEDGLDHDADPFLGLEGED